MNEYHITRFDNQLSLPFPDQSLQTLFSFDVLHRQSRHMVPNALNEYYRVLKHGGRLIICVPNLDWIARKYMEGKIGIAELDRLVYGNQEDQPDFIQTGFDIPRMTRLLRMAGFEDIQIAAFDELNMEVHCTKPLEVQNL